MLTRNQQKAVRAFFRDVVNATGIATLANAANADLYDGDTSSEDYPGFSKACQALREWCDEHLHTVFIDEDDYVHGREPSGGQECDTCDGTGYVWPEDKDGRSWMTDCPDEDCNAFGQFDPHYSEVDVQTIKRIIFGAELAQYI